MAQIFKLFCFAISSLLLTAAGVSKNSPSEDETKSNNQDKEEQKPPFLKTINKLKESRPVQLAKQLSSMAGEHLDTFSKNFESNLKAETKKQINDENSFVPNVIKSHIILPAKALAQTSIDSLREPVEKILSSVQKKYTDELTKSEQDKNYVPIIGSYTKRANKPVALLTASKYVVGDTFGSVFKKGSSLWRSSKKDKAEKPETEETKEDTKNK